MESTAWIVLALLLAKIVISIILAARSELRKKELTRLRSELAKSLADIRVLVKPDKPLENKVNPIRDLSEHVAKAITVVESSVSTFICNVIAELEFAKNDPEKIQLLIDGLRARQSEIAKIAEQSENA